MSAIQPDYLLLIVGGKTGLCDEPGYQWPHAPDHYERVLVYRADVVDMLQAECERLRAANAEQAAWIETAVANCAKRECSKRDEQLRDLRAELSALRSSDTKHAQYMSEVLNSGDGVYRP